MVKPSDVMKKIKEGGKLEGVAFFQRMHGKTNVAVLPEGSEGVCVPCSWKNDKLTAHSMSGLICRHWCKKCPHWEECSEACLDEESEEETSSEEEDAVDMMVGEEEEETACLMLF